MVSGTLAPAVAVIFAAVANNVGIQWPLATFVGISTANLTLQLGGEHQVVLKNNRLFITNSCVHARCAFEVVKCPGRFFRKVLKIPYEHAPVAH